MTCQDNAAQDAPESLAPTRVIRRKSEPAPTPVVDRDDYLLRVIVLVVVMVIGLGLGHTILKTALMLWGPK